MKPKKRSPRRSAEDSRGRILRAALSLIAKHGWAETSYQMIANKCQVSQSNILYHFRSRELLLRALIERISQNNFALVSAAIRSEHNAFERICLHFEKNIEWAVNSPEESQLILYVYYQATIDADFAKLFKAILDRAQGRILEYVFSGVRENQFNLTLSPELTAKTLHNVLVGATINLLSGQKEKVKNYNKMQWQKIIANLTGYQIVYSKI